MRKFRGERQQSQNNVELENGLVFIYINAKSTEKMQCTKPSSTGYQDVIAGDLWEWDEVQA